MEKTKLYQTIISFSLLLFVAFLFHQNSYASQLIYSIQTGSFLSTKKAWAQYDFLKSKLNQRALDRLRIEKIGEYYAVRVGIFQERSDAGQLYQIIKTHMPGAVIKHVYLIDERIIQSFESPLADKGEAEESGVPEKIDSQSGKEIDEREGGQSLSETTDSITSLVEKNEFNTALALVIAQMEADPEDPELNAWRGMVLLKMDQPGEALKYLKKAVELAPDMPDYYNGLGYSLFFMKKYDAAIVAFKNAVQLDPRHIDAHAGLCLGYAKTGDRGKALEILSKLKDLDKETSEKILAVIEGVNE